MGSWLPDQGSNLQALEGKVFTTGPPPSLSLPWSGGFTNFQTQPAANETYPVHTAQDQKEFPLSPFLPFFLMWGALEDSFPAPHPALPRPTPHIKK